MPKKCANPAKCCGAVIRGLWQSRPMTPATLRTLVPLCPAVKSEWMSLLRGEPVLTPLGRPDTLVYLMDATLSQLFSGLKSKSEEKWLKGCPAHVAPVHRYCACGLNPLLKYFTTGELALRAAAGPALGEEIEEVLLQFHALAQQEIEALCTVCQHKGIPGCCEMPGKPFRPQSSGPAASRARRSAPRRKSSGKRG